MQLSADIIRLVERDPGSLPETLCASLSDCGRHFNQVSIAVTGLAWLGAGVPSVQQEIAALIDSARFEISLCAYSITAGGSALIERIATVARQGVTANCVVNDFAGQPEEIRGLLLKLSEELPGRLNLFDFTPDNRFAQLHAKVLVVDRSVALVGSANLSFHGMVANHELAMVVRGPAAEEIAARLEALRKSAKQLHC
jgi:cardiolipin synthase